MKSGSGVGGRGGDGSRAGGGGLVDTRLGSSSAFTSVASDTALFIGFRSRKLGPFDLRARNELLNVLKNHFTRCIGEQTSRNTYTVLCTTVFSVRVLYS